MITLSKRLAKIAEWIPQDMRVADVGTDHGLLPLYLWENHKASSIILCDINEGPLQKARENIARHHAGQAFDLRRGDGLNPLQDGEVDVVVIAGMGGLLIRDILRENPQKTGSFGRFILQPRTAASKLRKWMREAGYSVLDECLVKEGKHICELIQARPPGLEWESGNGYVHPMQNTAKNTEEESLWDELSPILFYRHDPLLNDWIVMKLRIEEDIFRGICRSGQQDETRLMESAKRRQNLELALLLLARRKNEDIRTVTDEASGQTLTLPSP